MTELAVVPRGNVYKLEGDKRDIVRRQLCPKLTTTEFEYFCAVCERLGLDPITKQIHPVIRKQKGVDVLVIQTGIDGFRLIAERTGDYEGQTHPEWCGADGVWREMWLDANNPPLAARVGVYRRGFREPLFKIALWREYCQVYEGVPIGLWKTMPAGQLSKCAEALALRASFPNDLGNLYTHEEMAQADNNDKAAEIAQQREKEAELKKREAVYTRLARRIKTGEVKIEHVNAVLNAELTQETLWHGGVEVCDMETLKILNALIPKPAPVVKPDDEDTVDTQFAEDKAPTSPVEAVKVPDVQTPTKTEQAAETPAEAAKPAISAEELKRRNALKSTWGKLVHDGHCGSTPAEYVSAMFDFTGRKLADLKDFHLALTLDEVEMIEDYAKNAGQKE